MLMKFQFNYEMPTIILEHTWRTSFDVSIIGNQEEVGIGSMIIDSKGDMNYELWSDSLL